MPPRKRQRRAGADGRGLRSPLTGTGCKRRKVRLCRSRTFARTLWFPARHVVESSPQTRQCRNCVTPYATS